MDDFINPLEVKAEAEILAELVETIGISNEQISEIERTGTTSLATLIEISKKFALLQRRLAAYEPQKKSPPPSSEQEGENKHNMKRKRKKRKASMGLD